MHMPPINWSQHPLLIEWITCRIACIYMCVPYTAVCCTQCKRQLCSCSCLDVLHVNWCHVWQTAVFGRQCRCGGGLAA